MLAKAPGTILLAVALIAIAVWRVLEWAYRHRLEGAQEETQRLNRQISDYRNKLEGATPDEAKARMDALERQLNDLMPRKLTQDQKRTLEQEFRTLGASRSVTVCHDMSCADGKKYADEFTHFFGNILKWPVRNPSVLGPGNPPSTGLALRIKGGIPSAFEASVIEVFRRAGVLFDVQPEHGMGSDTDVYLLISSRIT